MSNADLRKRLVIVHGNLQHLDADFPVTVNPFPYIGEAAESNRVTSDFGEITRYGVRGRYGHTLTTDGL